MRNEQTTVVSEKGLRSLHRQISLSRGYKGISSEPVGNGMFKVITWDIDKPSPLDGLTAEDIKREARAVLQSL